MMTVIYIVAIIMFWWQFFGDGDHSFTAWRHKLMTNCRVIRTTFPQNYDVVGRVMMYNRGNLAIPMGHIQMSTQHVINMDFNKTH